MKKDLLYFRNNKRCILLLLLINISFSCRKTNIADNRHAIQENITNSIIDSFSIISEEDSVNIKSFTLIDTNNSLITAQFDFMGLSLEGGNGYAFYHTPNGFLSKSTINLFGESGHHHIYYDFEDPNYVNVKEIHYYYLVPFGEIINMKSSEKIDEIDTIFYYKIDNINNLKDREKRIYTKFKIVVPYKINNYND